MKNNYRKRSTAILLGVTIGVALGIALEEVAIGVGVGLVFVGAFLARSKRQEESNKE